MKSRRDIPDYTTSAMYGDEQNADIGVPRNNYTLMLISSSVFSLLDGVWMSEEVASDTRSVAQKNM